MKRITAIIIALIIGFGIAFAKSDYKNPVESQIVAELVIQPTQSPYYNVVTRNMYIAIDKYDNHYLSINVNYFVKKGKDKLEITLANGDNYTLELASSFKQYAYSFYDISKTATVHKVAYYEFFSVYPLTNEQYELIKEQGIAEIAVEGITQITIQ